MRTRSAAVVDVAESVLGVVGLAGDAEPEDVDGDAFFDERKVCGDAGEGVAAIAADGEVAGISTGPLGVLARTPVTVTPLLLDEIGGLPAHAELEGGVARGLRGEEVEEVPLRHEGDELGVRWGGGRGPRWGSAGRR